MFGVYSLLFVGLLPTTSTPRQKQNVLITTSPVEIFVGIWRVKG